MERQDKKARDRNRREARRYKRGPEPREDVGRAPERFRPHWNPEVKRCNCCPGEFCNRPW